TKQSVEEYNNLVNEMVKEYNQCSTIMITNFATSLIVFNGSFSATVVFRIKSMAKTNAAQTFFF
ncbi:MAG TPA: hypothetical protein VKC90_16305, partial [Chitinophagaceae bacterium]|nr:hypothetical protein [Chitinophagaceae bacterium]